MNGVYIHIPFCRSKCHYCNFPSGTYTDQELYFKTLYNEIENRPRFFDAIDTLYIGGGTPSCVNFHYIEQVINQIRDIYSTDTLSEITIEANPDSINRAFLKSARSIGINRLSIGIQSFNDHILQYLGRIHDSQTAINAVTLALNDFTNISIDIIYCIKGHRQNFNTIPKMPIKHVSAYMLQIEEGSNFHNRGLGDYFNEDEYWDLLKHMDIMELKRYEVSSFAANGYQSKHNCLYWNRDNHYIGYGLGASSYNGIERMKNTAHYRNYLEYPLSCNVEKLCRNDHVLEDIMLKMRTLSGISLITYKSIDKVLVDNLISDGLLYRDGDNIVATDRGFLILNDIINQLYMSYMENIRE